MKQYLSALLYIICSVALLLHTGSAVQRERYQNPEREGIEILSGAADELRDDPAAYATGETRETGTVAPSVTPGQKTPSARITGTDAESQTPDESEIPENIRLIAHRGYTISAPENTLPAFEAAARAGYDCIETDVRFTSDGTAVLLHRPVVDDTSNGTGEIADMTLIQARCLDFGARRGEEYAGTRIPTLEEGLAFCRGLELDVYLELKVPEMTPEQYQIVDHIVKDCGMRDHVTFISFYLVCLEGMAAQDTGYHFRFLTSSRDIETRHESNDVSVKTAMEYFWSIQETAGSVGISWNYTRLTPELAEEIKTAGLVLEAWTVDDIKALQAIPASCAAVTTNMITNS